MADLKLATKNPPGRNELLAKRRRLTAMAGMKHITDSQLAFILREVADVVGDDDMKISRWAFGRHIKTEGAKYLSSISLTLVKGGEKTQYDWDVCRLDLLLNYFLDDSQFLRDVMQEAVRKYGNRLIPILYSDEMTPGDAFAPDNKRKSWCFYVSFLELGAANLCQAEVWLPIAILRSCIVNKTEGGLSNVYRRLMHAWFCGDPCSYGTQGFVARLDLPTMIVFGKVLFLADLDGHRACYSWRGTSSLRPCFICRNCMKKGCAGCTSDSWLIDITCTDYERLDIATDEEAWAVVDLIKAAFETMAPADLHKLEQAHGMNHNPFGILQDIALRPFIKPSCIRIDPMHCMYVGGAMGHEMWKFMCSLKKEKLGFAEANAHVNADWKYPFHMKDKVAAMRDSFSEKRKTAAGRRSGIRLMASQFVTVYPIIRRFAEVSETPKIEDNCKSFYAMCDVADVLQEAKLQHYSDRKVMADQISELVIRYLKVREAVYGHDGTKPKHHKLMHLASQFLEDGMMLIRCELWKPLTSTKMKHL
jgi:hypothetical protein